MAGKEPKAVEKSSTSLFGLRELASYILSTIVAGIIGHSATNRRFGTNSKELEEDSRRLDRSLTEYLKKIGRQDLVPKIPKKLLLKDKKISNEFRELHRKHDLNALFEYLDFSHNPEGKERFTKKWGRIHAERAKEENALWNELGVTKIGHKFESLKPHQKREVFFEVIAVFVVSLGFFLNSFKNRIFDKLLRHGKSIEEENAAPVIINNSQSARKDISQSADADELPQKKDKTIAGKFTENRLTQLLKKEDAVQLQRG